MSEEIKSCEKIVETRDQFGFLAYSSECGKPAKYTISYNGGFRKERSILVVCGIHKS